MPTPPSAVAAPLHPPPSLLSGPSGLNAQTMDRGPAKRIFDIYDAEKRDMLSLDATRDLLHTFDVLVGDDDRPAPALDQVRCRCPRGSGHSGNTSASHVCGQGRRSGRHCLVPSSCK